MRWLRRLFPADKSFQHYANERGLKEEEIELIQQWVAQGSVEGKKRSVSGSQFKVGSKEVRSSLIDKKPDLVLKMQNAFTVPNTGVEEFRYFHVPTGLKEDVMVEAIAFLPGNRKVVHHSRDGRHHGPHGGIGRNAGRRP